MFNRREFIAASALASAALAACRHSQYAFLTEKDSATLAALCDQIIPADDFPSASQAGVLTYIDRQLTRHYRRHQQAYRDGLMQANLLSRNRFDVDLADASQQQQFEIATNLEQQNRPFFDLVRSHTMQGYYGSPRHGGNRDAASWRMLGLDEPPVRGRAQYDFTAASGSKP
ncbi:MAG TPA: gluconate 2-dehydrogenase subunit 3 family protein [Terracidiphilus sp.]|jgi:gluconate 2-dehydrogenase gamma chain